MCAFSLTQRILSLTTTLGANVLLPERLSGMEGISELFCYQLDLLAEVTTSVKPTDIVGKRVAIGIATDETGTQRYIHGMVSSFEILNGDSEFNCYRATIVPTMWMLTLTRNTRVYQNKTVTDVIKDVLSAYSISPTINTSNTYSPLEYCTQYRESDFNFISRLMEQHGIFYYFQHTADDHTLVLQDTSNKLSDCPIQNTFNFRAGTDKATGFYDFVIQEVSARSTMVTGKFTAWDYSFKRYQTITGTPMPTAGPLGANSNEAYDYAEATGFKQDATDTNLKSMEDFFTTAERDASDAETSILEGVSNAVCMQTGYSFSVAEHPIASVNTKYVLVHAELSVQQLPSYRSRTKEAPKPFSNTFRAVPFSIAYRSPIITEKPLVYGMHTGQVVVPAGEESHMDKYGRVNVQFWWDRLRQGNTPDNTWLRVAQSWAGKGWGTYYWPRMGDEVLIGFMEGDPDQPIVVGSVYNGVNMPKYDPVGQYTLSGILTRSSKGGGAANANELRFEDLAGKEQIFMNAEKDYDLHVENSWHSEVGAEQHLTVGAKQFEQIGGETHLHFKDKHYELMDADAHQQVSGNQIAKVGGDVSHDFGGNLKEKIGGDDNLNAGGNINVKSGANYSLDVGGNFNHKVAAAYAAQAGSTVYIKAGMTVVIEAGMEISLVVGGNFISIGPAGVQIMGTMVMINSGGAPGAGAPPMTTPPAAPDSPTAPKDPQFPGDGPPSQTATAAGGSAGTAPKITDSAASSSSPAAPPAPPASPAAAAAGAAAGAAGAAAGAVNQAEQQAQQAVNQLQQAANQAAQQASQAANQAAQQAQQLASQAQQAVQQAQQQAEQAVNQVTQQARAAYQQAQQAVQQAEQQVQQAAAQGQQAAQQALAQAQGAANQAAQQAAQAVQAAKAQAAQVEQQAQQAAAQAQQAAQQAQQQAQQAAQQAQQAANQAVQQAQQQVQAAAKQGQAAVSQAEQQAQGAANQAKAAASQAAAQATQAAQQAEQQAQGAANQAKQAASGAQQQVTQAASGAQQQAQQAAQGAQQAAQQAMNSAKQGF